MGNLLKIAIFSIIMIIPSCKTLESQFALISDEEIEMTKSNCLNLNLPASFIKVRESDLLVKSGLARYDTQYKSSASLEMVVDHFYTQLIPHGWEYSQHKEGGKTFLYFDKGKFSVEIESGFIGFSSDRFYGVGCRWGPSRKGLIGDLFSE